MVARMRSRTRLALVLLAPLICGIVWGAWQSRGHSAPSVHARTYMEMIRGVADNGLPYFILPCSVFPCGACSKPKRLFRALLGKSLA